MNTPKNKRRENEKEFRRLCALALQGLLTNPATSGLTPNRLAIEAAGYALALQKCMDEYFEQ